MKDLKIEFVKGIYYGRHFGALTSEICESAKIEGTVVIDNELVNFFVTLGIDTPRLREFYQVESRLSKDVMMRNATALVYNKRTVTEADEQELFKMIVAASSKKNKTNEKLVSILNSYITK
jgi:hypothetical protein